MTTEERPKRCDAGQPRPHTRFWTPARLAELQDLTDEGWSEDRIAAHFGRRVGNIRVVRSTYRVHARTARRSRTVRAVALRLGVAPEVARRWVRAGWLRCRVLSDLGRVQRFVDDDDLFAFMENPDYWGCWDAAGIPDGALREWAAEVRASTQLLTIGATAERLGVERGTVYSYVRAGLLPAVGPAGRLRVRAGDLAGFAPPVERPRAGFARRGWTTAERRKLLLLRGVGFTFEEIARRLGRSISGCSKEHAALAAGHHDDGADREARNARLVALAREFPDLSYGRLGALFGRSREAVRDYLLRHAPDVVAARPKRGRAA